MVQRLEAEGDVVRVSDPTDRRAILIRLSEVGREHLGQLRSDASAVLLPRLEQLRSTRLDELGGALMAIQHLIDTEPAPSGERLIGVGAPNQPRLGR